MYLSTYLYVSIYIYLYVSIYLYVTIYMYLSIYLSESNIIPLTTLGFKIPTTAQDGVFNL
jgi:hypothetical protein